VRWTDLNQLDWGGIQTSFDARSVVEILFAARNDAQPFNFWIDDIELMDDASPTDGGTDPGMGSGGTGNTNPSDCVLDDILGEAGFLDWFSARRNSFYTYQNLCTALKDFPGFANSGNATTDAQEVAAFFANVARETGELEYIDQIVKDPPTYFGRGPIQLTWDYNYRAAGDFIGVDLVSNPNLVSTDGVITWKTALWFWMHSDGAAKGTCNGAITQGRGFGQTINIINGGLECVGENTAARQRITYYEGYCSDLGVSPGANLTCW
jgi:predicted chitinase